MVQVATPTGEFRASIAAAPRPLSDRHEFALAAASPAERRRRAQVTQLFKCDGGRRSPGVPSWRIEKTSPAPMMGSSQMSWA